MKTCKTCQMNKRDASFYANRFTKCGLSSSCKKCMKKYQKKWYWDNVDYKRKYSRDIYREKVLPFKILGLPVVECIDKSEVDYGVTYGSMDRYKKDKS